MDQKVFLQLSSLTEWFVALCTCVQFLPTVNEEVPFWDFQLDWTFCRNPHKCTSLSHCVSSSASSDVQIDWTFCCNLNRCLSLSHCASASASSDFQLYWMLCWNQCWNLGKPSFKKIYFAKNFHKTVAPPPRRGFMKAYSFLGAIFWGLYIVL